MNPATQIRALFCKDATDDLVRLGKEVLHTAMLEPSLVNWNEVRMARDLLEEVVKHDPR